MDFAALRVLIETHPTHAVTSDTDMITWLEDATAVTRNRAAMPVNEMVEVAVSFPADYAALSVDKRDALALIANLDSFDLTDGTPVREALEVIFAGTSILTELAGRLTEDVSRLNAAGLGTTVAEGEVAYARTFGD